MRKARCDVVRAFTGAVMLAVFVVTLTLCGECLAAKSGAARADTASGPFNCGEPGFHVTSKGLMAWTAPSGRWVLAGMHKFVIGKLNEMLARKPAGANIFKVFERVVSEKGEWRNFVVKLCGVRSVVFTKSTRIVLTDKAGRCVVSETILFWRDAGQTEVCDAAKWPVVVGREGLWCPPGYDQPMGAVKFPAGEFAFDDIVSFEVVGAVEQRGDGEAR